MRRHQKSLLDDIALARAFYRVCLSYPHGQNGKWAKVAEDMKRLGFPAKAPNTWKEQWAKLRTRYGLLDSRYYGKGEERRPLDELTEPEKVSPAMAIFKARQAGTEKADIVAEPRIFRLSGDQDSPPQPSQWPSVLREGSSNREAKASVHDVILGLLEKKTSMAELCATLELPDRIVRAYIEHLQEQGYQIVEVGGWIWHETMPLLKNNIHVQPWNGERIIRFGVVSDTHDGSKTQQLTHLNTFYDRCEAAGIDTIYHVGDLSDGLYTNRPEHIFELHVIGLEETSRYIIKNYPKRKGIKTKFITGNHDATFTKNGGGDIGARVAAERPDMEYLGYGRAKVWLTPKCDMDMVHPLGGKAYALSYRLQKAIDALQGGTKPRILLMGHYHAFCFIFYRNIHAFMVPGFQAQNTWASLSALLFQVGGIIFEVGVTEEGEVGSITTTLCPYYVMNENDY